jgi:hypothetical protein
MTAYVFTSSREMCLVDGMDNYPSKPVDRNQLLDVLLKWLVDDEVLSLFFHPLLRVIRC